MKKILLVTLFSAINMYAQEIRLNKFRNVIIPGFISIAYEDRYKGQTIDDYLHIEDCLTSQCIDQTKTMIRSHCRTPDISPKSSPVPTAEPGK